MPGCGISFDKLAAAEPFDYFAAKAASLGKDPQRILTFVRDEVHTLPYRGNVKGALGALWDSSASADEKVALADALLAHSTTPKKVSLDDVADKRDKAADAGAKACQITITHRVLSDRKRETPIYSGPVGDLVGDAHTVDCPAAGQTRFTLRTSAAPDKPVSKTINWGKADIEEIVFTVERHGDKPITVTRELWNKANRTGPREPRIGDRHDFVVLPCRITKYVREKEELLLKQRKRQDAEEAKPYLGLLDYAMASDLMLAKVEKAQKTRAQFELPRILIYSKFNLVGQPAYAMDLRLDRTAFEGDRIDAYLSCQMRSFIESGLEQMFLLERTGLPSTSTFDVFGKLKDDFPNSQDRRLDLMVSALAALEEHGGADGSVTFRACGADGKADKDAPSIVATRGAAGGLRVRGGPVPPQFAANLAKADVKIPYSADGKLDARFDSPQQAAMACEVTLAASKGVSLAYVLDTRIDCGREPLVAPGAIFTFRWGQGDSQVDQRIRILECASGLSYKYRVKDGIRPAVGQRTISPAALDDSLVQNPWYRSGNDIQDDASSFCISRKAFAALAGGKSVDLTVLGRYTEHEGIRDQRPVEWKGAVKPAGKSTCKVKVNGQEQELRLVKCDMGGKEAAVLDDALFPVGMADKLLEVSTCVRGRVVDEKDIGIGQATVLVGEGDNPLRVTTWPDGSFRLPASLRGDYGKVKITVTRNNETLAEPQEIDLTNPGLKTTTIKAQRHRKGLVFIKPDQMSMLAALPVSPQVKRHAARDLKAGHMVVIPDRMVPMGRDLVAIGYYAYDVLTGNIVGVTEDGLHGSSMLPPGDWDAALKSLLEDLKATKGETPASSLAYVHMYRGANTAAWTYCAYRLEGMEHAEAIMAVLSQMEYWEKATNIMENFGEAVGDKPKEKLGELIDKGIGGLDDDWAKVAFKFGYMSTCAGLGLKLEGS